MVSLPHFFTQGAPLRAPCARELRYNNSNDVTRILEWRFISLSYLRLKYFKPFFTYMMIKYSQKKTMNNVLRRFNLKILKMQLNTESQVVLHKRFIFSCCFVLFFFIFTFLPFHLLYQVFTCSGKSCWIFEAKRNLSGRVQHSSGSLRVFYICKCNWVICGLSGVWFVKRWVSLSRAILGF